MSRVIDMRLMLAACVIAVVGRAHVANASPTVDCDATLNPIFSNLHRAFVAMDANMPHQAAHDRAAYVCARAAIKARSK